MLMLACVKWTAKIDRMTRVGEWNPRNVVENTELGGKASASWGSATSAAGWPGSGRQSECGCAAVRHLRARRRGPRRGAEPVASLEELLPQANVLTCHTPLTPETRHMIDEKTLALLPPGAIFVNTSRGAVQSEPALFEALVTGRLAAAGLDVFEQEPSPLDNPLFNLDNVVCSTHVAGVTREAHRVASLQVTGEVLRVLRGERPQCWSTGGVGPAWPGHADDPGRPRLGGAHVVDLSHTVEHGMVTYRGPPARRRDYLTREESRRRYAEGTSSTSAGSTWWPTPAPIWTAPSTATPRGRTSATRPGAAGRPGRRRVRARRRPAGRSPCRAG